MRKRKRRKLVLAVVVGGIITAFIIALFSLPSGSYYFRVVRNRCDVWINRDGSIDVEYNIEFENYGRPIDVVDIGLPHPGYRLRTAKAELIDRNGTVHTLTDIRPSTYIEVGVEVHLHGAAIPDGETAKFHLRINVPDMVFPDTADDDYASVEFVPTWFAPNFVSGGTLLVVKFHFPEWVGPNEPRYHGIENPPQKMGYEGDRFTYAWMVEDAEQRPYRFGASFPKKGMRKTAEFWRYNREWLFGGRRSTSSSGSSRWSFARFLEEGGGSLLIIFIIIAVSLTATYLRRHRVKRQYISPRLAVEGVGVRKGLSPAEAAVLLELPPGKIVGIAILDLVEKGIIRIESVSPLKVELLKDEKELEPYQRRLVEALTEHDKRTARQERIKGAFILLVRRVQKKMIGYSYRETKRHYERIVDESADALASGDLKFVCWSLLTDDRDLEDALKERVEVERRRHYPFLTYDDYWWMPFRRRFIYDSESFCRDVLKVTNPRAYAVLTGPSGGGGFSGFGGCACACACAGCACACAGGGR